MNEIKCPECGSDEVVLTWYEPPGLPETELGYCMDCGKHWNQCARRVMANKKYTCDITAFDSSGHELLIVHDVPQSKELDMQLKTECRFCCSHNVKQSNLESVGLPDSLYVRCLDCGISWEKTLSNKSLHKDNIHRMRIS